MFLIRKISEIFGSKEKKFIQDLNESLDVKNYVNLGKVESKLSLKQRIGIVRDLKKKGSIQGIYLQNKNLFFSMDESSQNKLRDNLKTTGKVEIKTLKRLWKVKNKFIETILQSFERGIMGNEFFYTRSFLINRVKQELSDKEECVLDKMVEQLGVDLEAVLGIINNLIENKVLTGVIKKPDTYLSKQSFDELMLDYLENAMNEKTQITFDEASQSLSIDTKYIEPFLISYAKENPDLVVVYPVEKRLQFKE